MQAVLGLAILLLGLVVGLILGVVGGLVLALYVLYRIGKFRVVGARPGGPGSPPSAR